MTLVADVFPKLETAKNVGRQMSKKSRFRRPFNKQHDKQSQTLLKSERQHLCHIYWSLWRKLSFRKSLQVICKILGLFVNTLTTNDKYSVLNRVNLTQPIQIQLSNTPNLFVNLFLLFSNLDQIFNIFFKRWPSCLMYFRSYGLWKRSFDKCLKRPTSEDPSTW